MYLDHVHGNLQHLEEGDKVMVRGHYRTEEGEVVKKAVKYLTVRYGGSQEAQFLRATGQYRYEGNLMLYSLEQWERNQRMDRIKSDLRDLGIDLRNSHSLTLDTMEKVIALVRKEQG